MYGLRMAEKRLICGSNPPALESNIQWDFFCPWAFLLKCQILECVNVVQHSKKYLLKMENILYFQVKSSLKFVMWWQRIFVWSLAHSIVNLLIFKEIQMHNFTMTCAAECFRKSCFGSLKGLWSRLVQDTVRIYNWKNNCCMVVLQCLQSVLGMKITVNTFSDYFLQAVYCC